MAALGLVVAACGGTAGADGWGSAVGRDGLIILPDDNGELSGITPDGEVRWVFPDDAVEVELDENVDLDAIYGTPALTEGRIYIGGFDDYLYALDQQGDDDPSLAWRHQTEGSVVGGAAVSEDGEMIVFGSSDHGVYAVNADGERLWRFRTGERVWSTPALDGERIYVGSMDGHVYALDSEGQQAWSFDTSAAIAASPVVDGDTVYIGSFSSKLYALDAATGDERWSFDTDNWIWTDAVVADDRVFVTSLDGHTYALDAETGDQIWEVDTGKAIRSRPVIAGDLLVVANRDGDILGIDAASGEVAWRQEASVGDDVLSDLSLIDEAIYVRNEDGDLYEVDPDDGAVRPVTRQDVG
ncbi:MAG: PQQ-binding-like beta-propeller repeat protein [Dehalococcoidia bacterium]